MYGYFEHPAELRIGERIILIDLKTRSFRLVRGETGRHLVAFCGTHLHPNFNKAALMVVISRSSAILTDIVVLVVTLKKTLPSYRSAVRANVKLPIVTALVVDGTPYCPSLTRAHCNRK